MATVDEYTAKWNDFFSRGFAPWDTRQPASQLLNFVEHSQEFSALRAECEGGGTPVRSIEIGCGSGAATRYLAEKGCQALGVDLVPGVVALARRISSEQLTCAAPAAPAGRARWPPVFVQADAFQLPKGFSFDRAAASVAGKPVDEEAACVTSRPAANDSGNFDFVFDCQCFHCLRVFDEGKAVEAVANLLRPGGLLLVMTGNANEPEISPAVLTKAELIDAFTANGKFAVLNVQEGRFDSTPDYDKLPHLPLAWIGVFRRQTASADTQVPIDVSL